MLKGWEHLVALDKDENKTNVLKSEEVWTTVEDESSLANSRALNAIFNGVDKNVFKMIKQCNVAKCYRPNTKQLRPSGCEYDNGVVDVQRPKCYVVWIMNMNTHIYPEFVVSFKPPKVDTVSFFMSFASYVFLVFYVKGNVITNFFNCF